MFAPEEVFSKKSAPLPRGHYFPSPYNEEFDGCRKSVCESINTNNVVLSKNHKKGKYITDSTNINKNLEIDFMEKESKNEINQEKTSSMPLVICEKENAATSVDDLIRDIDQKLAVDPDFNPPEALGQEDVNNILSVSENSNTNFQESIISPTALNFYVDRFNNGDPTHPSKRYNHEHQKSTTQTIEGNMKINEPAKNLYSEKQYDEISYKTLSLDSSSFLSNILSSDDSIAWEFPEELSVKEDLKSLNIPYKQQSYEKKYTDNEFNVHENRPSLIKEITGKTFSQLSELVPNEILNPTNENEDVLYQWRLKKRMTEAKSHNLKTDLDLPSIKVTEPYFLDENVTEVSNNLPDQKNVEKTEFSCQVDINPIAKTNKMDDNSCLTCLSNQKGHLNVLNYHVNDSCSDFSISSVSTDDLTNISLLDEDDEPLMDGEDLKLDQKIAEEKTSNVNKNFEQSPRKTPDYAEVNLSSNEATFYEVIDENDDTIENEPITANKLENEHNKLLKSTDEMSNFQL